MTAPREFTVRRKGFTAGPTFAGLDGQVWHLPDLDRAGMMKLRDQLARVTTMLLTARQNAENAS